MVRSWGLRTHCSPLSFIYWPISWVQERGDVAREIVKLYIYIDVYGAKLILTSRKQAHLLYRDRDKDVPYTLVFLAWFFKINPVEINFSKPVFYWGISIPFWLGSKGWSNTWSATLCRTFLTAWRLCAIQESLSATITQLTHFIDL